MNTQLTDRRIETMRAHVLDAVDADIRKRGGKVRTRLGLVAAGAVVVAAGSIGYQSLSTSVSDLSAADAGKAGDGAATSEMAEAPIDALLADGDFASDDANDSASGVDEGRDIITSGYIEATVKDPRESAQRLSTWVTSVGGRIDSRSENGGEDSDGIYSSLTIRVPSDKVTEAIERLRKDGTVTSVSINNTDVTAQTRDLDARIKALKISISRLEALLQQATTTSAIINAENALTDRQQQLESLTTERRYTADQVSLSTLGVSLSPTAKADTVSAGGFKGGFIDGWNALVSAFNKGVEGLGAAIPWIAVLALLYGAWRLIARRRAS